MRALREANTNTGIDILDRQQYMDLQIKDPNILYIVGTIGTDGLTVTEVYVGEVEHDVLLNNAGEVVWMKTSMIVSDKETLGQSVTSPQSFSLTLTGTHSYFDGTTIATEDVTSTGTATRDVTQTATVSVPSFNNLPIPLTELV